MSENLEHIITPVCNEIRHRMIVEFKDSGYHKNVKYKQQVRAIEKFIEEKLEWLKSKKQEKELTMSEAGNAYADGMRDAFEAVRRLIE